MKRQWCIEDGRLDSSCLPAIRDSRYIHFASPFRSGNPLTATCLSGYTGARHIGPAEIIVVLKPRMVRSRVKRGADRCRLGWQVVGPGVQGVQGRELGWQIRRHELEDALRLRQVLQ